MAIMSLHNFTIIIAIMSLHNFLYFIFFLYQMWMQLCGNALSELIPNNSFEIAVKWQQNTIKIFFSKQRTNLNYDTYLYTKLKITKSHIFTKINETRLAR